jgi:hypothetical protein
MITLKLTIFTYAAKFACTESGKHAHRPRAASGLLDPPVFVKDLLEDLERV